MTDTQDLLHTITSPRPGERLPARSWRADEPMRLSLAGTWRFRLSDDPRLAPADAADPSFDDSGWDELQVPGHWALQGHGKPIYTNVQFPIPLEPPFVPDENPTGDHRRSFTVPDDWQADRLLLRFDGIESLGIVSLNGQRVGVTTGSRLPTEFDVTELVQPGENLLHVRVVQWSANTYLEDQDQWWLAGIFRDVALVGRPAAGIDDFWLQSEVDTDGSGTIVPEVRCSDAAFPVRLRVDELGVDVTWANAAEVQPVAVGRVDAWTPETPTLYRATLECAAETVSTRLGFRTVRIDGRSWTVNGVPLRLRGVNRHDFHPSLGRVFEPEDARRNLLQMKRHHVNAVRTSHYPPHPALLELCDELGFWVVDECDLETHGFELVDWNGNPSDDPRWRENYVDRAERLVERDKNHPSIICWSLGNESGTGANLAAMADHIRRRDPARPIHYEGDHDGAYTDVISQMYTPLQGMQDMSAGRGVALSGRPAQMRRLLDRPMMLCEYGHAMGNGPGALAEYDEHFELPGWHGGFVWEWRDHGLDRTLPDGRVVPGYGGDFGEVVHDGSFVCDGLVLPDGTPSSGLVELAAVNQPLALQVRDGQVQLTNRFAQLDSSVADLHWRLLRDGVAVRQGTLEVPVVGARQSGTVGLPKLTAEGRDEWLEVTAVANDRFREHQPWLGDEELVLGRTQHQLEFSTATRTVPRATAAPRQEPTRVHVGPAELCATTGRLLSLAGVPVTGFGAELWRAPTENDRLATHGSYELADPALTGGYGVDGPSSAERWRAAGLDRLVCRTESVRVEGDEFVVVQRLLPAQGQRGADVAWRWQAVEDGVRLQVDVRPTLSPGEHRSTWPRVGVHLGLPLGIDQASWYGMGPGQAYPDSRRAARLGRWSLPLDELTEPLVVPQENGHRADVRWLELDGAAGPLRVNAVGERRFGFVASRHDVREQTAAAHQEELPDPSATHLYLDMAQHGLGTRSCGPDVLPEHQLWPAQQHLDVVLSAGATT